MTNNRQSNYRWYILALAALTHTFAVAMPTMCMPVLFKEIADELGLNLVQVGTVWGMTSLTGVFVCLVGGLIGDRYGTKRTLSIACLLGGLASALRGLSGSFSSLTATVFLFSLLTAIVPMSVHKVCGVWFPRRQLGLANGIVSMGMALGFMLGSMLSATVLSPLLGGWRNVMFLYGARSVAISIFWFLSRGEPGQVEATTSTSAVPFRQTLLRVARISDVWFLMLIVTGVSSCYQGMLGYLPLYLREIGWTVAHADGALAAFHGLSMISVVPLALLSDRLGSRKRVLFVAALMTALGAGLLSVADGALVWVSVLIAGMVRDGFWAIFSAMVMETEGIGAAYAGTAMGLIFTFSRIGSFASPPLGNSLASINLRTPFIFWASLAAVALFGFYFVKGTGHSKDKAIGGGGDAAYTRLPV